MDSSDSHVGARTDRREFCEANVSGAFLDYQFWQQHNKPIELWSVDVIDQKVDYIHHNPVKSGFVSEPHYRMYSSAVDYNGGKDLLELAEL